MSQVNLHGLMFQEKLYQTNQQSISIGTENTDTQHCAQSFLDSLNQEKQTAQCQTFLSVTDSSSVNNSLSIVFPDFNSSLFFIPFLEPSIARQGNFQLKIYNFIIKSFFPSISIRLHSFLI